MRALCTTLWINFQENLIYCVCRITFHGFLHVFFYVIRFFFLLLTLENYYYFYKFPVFFKFIPRTCVNAHTTKTRGLYAYKIVRTVQRQITNWCQLSGSCCARMWCDAFHRNEKHLIGICRVSELAATAHSSPLSLTFVQMLSWYHSRTMWPMQFYFCCYSGVVALKLTLCSARNW